MSGLGMSIALSVLGAAGLLLLASGWLQPAPTLARTVAHLRRSSAGAAPSGAVGGRRRAAVAALAEALRAEPRLVPSETQLRLLNRPLEQHALYLIVGLLGGLVVPTATVTVLQGAGVLGANLFVPVVVALAGSLVGVLVVHANAIERAAAIRDDLRYQVSAYLDVVTMLLAGNSGYEGALEQASRAGDGRLFGELRRRMREAGTRGASLTDALHTAGSELGLAELEQVAATASLSAAEGAPVARTLAAKCATLRAALAAEQESEARLRTSRLTTPIVGMALIFMALVIYPALSFS